jgi:uncharacterized membrane protein
MSDPLVVLTIATAVGSAAVGGVFFAFSTFVTAALRRLPPAQGLAAMQSINVTAPMPPLMLLMFGTALACVALIVAAVVSWGEPFAPWLLAGAVVYLLGEIAVTMAYNVPRNNELAALDPDAAEAAARWPSWIAEWTAGNHVRTVAGLAAAAALLIALHVA